MSKFDKLYESVINESVSPIEKINDWLNKNSAKIDDKWSKSKEIYWHFDHKITNDFIIRSITSFGAKHASVELSIGSKYGSIILKIPKNKNLGYFVTKNDDDNGSTVVLKGV